MSEHLAVILALLFVGYVLLALELFVIPGFGVTGVTALICLGAGCWMAVQSYGPAEGSAVVVVVGASVVALAYWIPRSRLGRAVIHDKSLKQARAVQALVVVGEFGVAESDLRPAGIGRFGDRRESVVTGGEYVSFGSKIRVVGVEGARVLVETVPAEAAANPEPRAQT